MDTLRTYLNHLEPTQQIEFARKVGTTINYLRNAISTRKNLGADLCISIERESGRAVTCEDLRPDVDWAFLRRTTAKEIAAHGA